MRRLLLVLALLGAATGVLAAVAEREEIDLINVALGPAWANWMIGPWGRMATDRELVEFRRLDDDAEAEAWVEAFWARRDPDPERPGNPVRQLAEQRAEEADRRFTEGTIPGRRSDRGTVFVLYGEPEEIDHESGPKVGDPVLEIWRYPKGAEAGLDGERPDRRYRFAESNGRVRFYVPGRDRRFLGGLPQDLR